MNMSVTRAGRATGGSRINEDLPIEAVAKELARKQLPRLKKLDPLVARRRLVGMLQRRGFDYDSIRPVLDEVLGKGQDDEANEGPGPVGD